jgi:hypothetical protein
VFVLLSRDHLIVRSILQDKCDLSGRHSTLLKGVRDELVESARQAPEIQTEELSPLNENGNRPGNIDIVPITPNFGMGRDFHIIDSDCHGRPGGPGSHFRKTSAT